MYTVHDIIPMRFYAPLFLFIARILHCNKTPEFEAYGPTKYKNHNASKLSYYLPFVTVPFL